MSASWCTMQGIQYRELDVGTIGPEAVLDAICEITYTVYRLSSGAYFKYSSGGTPVLLFALGYGTEGKDDIGLAYRFRWAFPCQVPVGCPAAFIMQF